MISVLATILVLKLVEGTGSLEFDRWDGVVYAAVTCWLGAWGAEAAMTLAFLTLKPFSGQISIRGSAISTMISLLVAWAVLPGVHVRRLSGLVLAAILVTGLNYLAIMLMSATVGSLL